MRFLLLVSFSALCLGLYSVTETCLAGKFNRLLSVGDEAPPWDELPGVDGESHSWSEQKEHKLLVVIFTRNHCPESKLYDERVRKLVEEFEKEEVGFIALNVSHLPGETMADMKKWHAEKKFPINYLRDESQAIGRAFGATTTPQVFLLDPSRKILYMGAIDDQSKPTQETQSHLANAVRAALKGDPIEIEETRPRGCEIKYLGVEEEPESP